MYNFVLTMACAKAEGTKNFSETVQRYFDLSYDDLLAVQDAVVNSLLDLGKAKAAASK